VALGLLILAAAQAASPTGDLMESRIRAADTQFWAAFNACDREGMTAWLDPAVEFYHDKTGATVSRERVAASFMDGPCGSKDLHMRRAPIAASLHYDPIPGYGGMLTGRHRFYARSGDQPEKLTTEARFAVVWHQAGDRVLISRVLSSTMATRCRTSPYARCQSRPTRWRGSSGIMRPTRATSTSACPTGGSSSPRAG